MDEKQLRTFKAYFEVRGKSPTKIIGSIPYRSRSHPIGSGFIEELWPGVFSESLASGRDIKSFWNHETGKVLGSTAAGTLRLIDSNKELRIELTPPNNSWGKDALESVARGDTNGFSFSFLPTEEDLSDDGEIRYVKKASLYSVDPTAIPAYPESKAYARSRSFSINQDNELQKMKNHFMGEEKKMVKSFAEIREHFDKQNFRTFTEQLAAIQKTDLGVVDNKLRSQGLNELIASEGGFLAIADFSNQFMTGPGMSELKKRCTEINLKEHAYGVDLPKFAEDSRETTEFLGGLQWYWIEEGTAPSYEKFKTSLLKLRVHKNGCLIPISDELFSDVENTDDILLAAGQRGFNRSFEYELLHGRGSARPLGILNSGATIEVATDQGQNAGTISTDNVLNLIKHLPPESFTSPGLCFQTLGESLPEIAKLSLAVGQGGSAIPLFHWKEAGEKFNKLCGIDVIINQHCQPLGTRGDLVLSDLSQYLTCFKRVKNQYSIHVLWDTDEGVFKFLVRWDGMPALSKPITPATGSTKLTPFVVIETRS
jgi:HK97 family phage major capsid protein/HK97 family phage prohead protease